MEQVLLCTSMMVKAVRIIFVVLFLMAGFKSAANESYFLKSSEKAVLGLVLKSLTLDTTDRLELINRIQSRLETSNSVRSKTINVKTFDDFLVAYKNDRLFAETQLNDLSINDLFNEIFINKANFRLEKKLQISKNYICKSFCRVLFCK